MAIKALTFTTGDMKKDARKALEDCMAYITEYNETTDQFALLSAAKAFGRACVWLDNLSDIGIELHAEDEHVNDMLDIAQAVGLEW